MKNIVEVQKEVSKLISSKEPTKFSYGKLEKALTINEFEKLFNVKVAEYSSTSNEYGTLDYVAESITKTEDNTTIIIHIEINKDKVTHINNVDEY